MSKAYKISHPTRIALGKIQVPGSKSESNRLLILKNLYFPKLAVEGLSTSNDTSLMQDLLNKDSSDKNVEDAGTVMRFLTAYLSVSKGEYTLRGTTRMHQRPIEILVSSLRKLGANIEYLEEEGYPPLKIVGSKIKGGRIEVDSSISSQFISALLMVAPKMQDGLSIKLKGKPVSKPYIQLTIDLMLSLGLQVNMEDNEIHVPQLDGYVPNYLDKLSVEPDWSSASYWYLICAIASKSDIELSGFKEHSLQGDRACVEIFNQIGVESSFNSNGLLLRKSKNIDVQNLDLIENPDLAQSLVTALAALNIKCEIEGLQTLKWKETDRLKALKTELEKAGAQIRISDDSLEVVEGIRSVNGIKFSSWDDHRMAMSLAALALIEPLVLEDVEVVKKSYPTFWEDLRQIGFIIEKV